MCYNSPMKIWIVNPFDNLPLEGYRPQRFWMMVDAFAKSGHNVTFWSSDFSHSNKSKRIFSSTEISTAENELGGKIILVNTPSYKRNISFKRILSHIRFSSNWLSAAQTQPEIPDLIIASSPPLSLGRAVRKFAKGKNIPYVIDIVDAWPEAFEQILPSMFLYPLKNLAKANYKNANVITTVSKRFTRIAKKSGTSAPVGFFPIGIPPVAITGHHKPNTPTRLLYLGAIGVSYDLETIVKAVAKLPDVTLDVAGSGPNEEHLRSLAATAPNIHFHGYLQKNAMNELLEKSDVGIIPMFDKSHVGIPCKLADYLSFGLPVLNSLHGEVSEMLEKAHAGFTYETLNEESFITALNHILGEDAMQLRQNALALAQQFNAEKIYPRYVEFVTSSISKENKNS